MTALVYSACQYKHIKNYLVTCSMALFPFYCRVIKWVNIQCVYVQYCSNASYMYHPLARRVSCHKLKAFWLNEDKIKPNCETDQQIYDTDLTFSPAIIDWPVISRSWKIHANQFLLQLWWPFGNAILVLQYERHVLWDESCFARKKIRVCNLHLSSTVMFQ